MPHDAQYKHCAVLLHQQLAVGRIQHLESANNPLQHMQHT
jgi:hypothetical protein